MNVDSESMTHRLLALLQAVRDTHDDSARVTLNELLRNDSTARAAMARLLVDEQAIIHRLRDDVIVSLLAPPSSVEQRKVTRWLSWQAWRPLSAAAAGIVFGMFCTTVVFGFVVPRMAALKKVPLPVFEPGMENADLIFAKSVPRGVGQWGADSAAVVTSENDVQPLEGKRMLRLEPIPPEKDVKNHSSRVYQVLDLRSLPLHGIGGDAEVLVSASFFAANADVTSRYLIRAIALKESPETATKGFWPKTEDDGVVSVAQRFETSPGDRGWHTFSLKMPFPRGAQSLVFILGALPPDDASAEASAHYLDDVRVSVLTSHATLP